MSYTITVYRDEGGEWRWRLTAPNGERVAASGEAFDSKGNAKRSAERLADLLVADEMHATRVEMED